MQLVTALRDHAVLRHERALLDTLLLYTLGKHAAYQRQAAVRDIR